MCYSNRLLSLFLLFIPLLLIIAPRPSAAADLQETLISIRQEWAKINYQLSEDRQEKAFAALVERAEEFGAMYPERPEPKVWEAIIRSSYAGAMGGVKSLFSAMPQVKKARDLLLAAEKIDPAAENGSALTSLGSLYYMVPGWPIGFGNAEKAEQYLQKALVVNPDGIDPNYFYGDFLLRQGKTDNARRHLQKALQAPPRPGRNLADSGRIKEVEALLSKL